MKSKLAVCGIDGMKSAEYSICPLEFIRGSICLMCAHRVHINVGIISTSFQQNELALCRKLAIVVEISGCFVCLDLMLDSIVFTSNDLLWQTISASTFIYINAPPQ